MSELKYWLNGVPVIVDDGLGELKYWIDGEPFVFYFAAPSGTNITIDGVAVTRITIDNVEVTGLTIDGTRVF